MAIIGQSLQYLEGVKPADMQDADLLKLFKYIVKRDHYDPVDSWEPHVEADALEAEISRRMCQSECGYRKDYQNG